MFGRQLVRQIVYTMFITNNHASLHLWWKEILVKYQKISKYYVHDCTDLNVQWTISFENINIADENITTWKTYSLETPVQLLFILLKQFLTSASFLTAHSVLLWQRHKGRLLLDITHFDENNYLDLSAVS